MKEEKDSLKDNFEREIEKIKSETVLSPEYRKKKTIIWLIRTSLAVLLYALLWEYSWIKWTLIFYIPLNLFGLFSIFGWNFLLRNKIAKTSKKISEIELGDTDEDR